jgi:NAD(P)H dehydrogenase (quinone)
MPDWRTVNVLICFYSRYSSTAKLAEAVAEGARMTPGDTVWLRRVPEIESEVAIRQDERWWRAHEELVRRYPEVQSMEVSQADALVLGSPGYFGNMAAPMKHWLERQFAQVWRGEGVGDKAGAAFCTTSTLHGGNELTITSLLTALMHLSCVVVPAGYLEPTLRQNELPYGASAVTGPDDEAPLSEADLIAARALGFRVAHVARCLLVGRGREEFRRHQQHWTAGSTTPTP